MIQKEGGDPTQDSQEAEVGVDPYSGELRVGRYIRAVTGTGWYGMFQWETEPSPMFNCAQVLCAQSQATVIRPTG